jgi:hypothetical protein
MLLHLKLPVTVSLVLLFSLNACKGPSIQSDGRVPPTFSFTGGQFAEYRHLHFFFVHDETTNQTNWQIWPDRYESGDAGKLPVIVYGKVPAGWTQKIPAQGEPPALIEGHVYEAGGPPTDSHLGHMRFTIREGAFVRLNAT